MEMKQATSLEQLKLLAKKTKSEADKLSEQLEQLAEYSIIKQETANIGFIATYQLTKDNTSVGDKINIPKDFLVKDVRIKDVETENQPFSSAVSIPLLPVAPPLPVVNSPLDMIILNFTPANGSLVTLSILRIVKLPFSALMKVRT